MANPTVQTASSATYADASSVTAFTFTFPYIDKDHLVFMDDDVEGDLATAASITRDRATGATTITFDAGKSGTIVIYRDTPVPDQSGVRPEDSKHGSSLAIDSKPASHQLQFVLEEILDTMDDLAGQVEDLAEALGYASADSARKAFCVVQAKVLARLQRGQESDA